MIVEAVQNLKSSSEIRRGTPSDGTYRLRVRKRQGDEDDIVIPPMGAIDDLVDTIQRKNDYVDRSLGDVETLESFNRLLEEDL